MPSVLEPPARAPARAGMAAGDAQALIAEARAHARRRRRRIALAAIAAVSLAGAALLIARGPGGSRPAPAATWRPAQAAGATGIVTGHLEACTALPMVRPVTPGTVTVQRGKVTMKNVGPGRWQFVFPRGPVIARQHISNNYRQSFRFALPPGQYVLEGRYDPPERDGRPVPLPQGAGIAWTWIVVTVTADRMVREDLPNDCV